MGTTGGKSARRGDKRTDQVLIAAYQWNYHSAHLYSTWLNNFSKSSVRVTNFQEKSRFTITTISNLQALMLCWRNFSRMILLTRFRSDALGNVFLLAIIPSLALFSQLHAKNTLNCLSAIFSPRKTWSKPSARNNRYAAVYLNEMLDRESCTALGAARPDNCAAPACLHAHQKTMGAFSFDYGWLVGAFHIFFLGKS